MDLLQSMELVTKLAQLGSFTKAADALSLSRPQATRALKELEGSLGVRLFQRTTRSVRLTAEGEKFCTKARSILGDIDEVTAMFGHPGKAFGGRIRIDIPAAFAQQRFMEGLREFHRAYPDIEIVLGATDRAVDLVSEGVDCALRLGELPDSTLISRPIGMATMVTCAAPSYLREFGEPRCFEDLAQHQSVRFLSGQNNRPLAWQFSVAGCEKSYVGKPAMTVNESTSYVQCGIAGFGILQAPGITLDQHLASGSLVEILRPLRPKPRPVTILYPSQAHLSPAVEVFVQWLRERFPSLHPAWFEPARR